MTAIMIVGAGTIVLTVTCIGVSRPIDRLVHSFKEVGTGGSVSRVEVRRMDEFGRLAAEFNKMCSRLEETRDSLVEEQSERRRAEDRLRHVEPLVSIGRLSAGLAHEIGTPLDVIGGRAVRRRLSTHRVLRLEAKRAR